MSDIDKTIERKMSDVFKLPLAVEYFDSPEGLGVGGILTEDKTELLSCPEPDEAEAICRAVNSHDTLKAELTKANDRIAEITKLTKTWRLKDAPQVLRKIYDLVEGADQ